MRLSEVFGFGGKKETWVDSYKRKALSIKSVLFITLFTSGRVENQSQFSGKELSELFGALYEVMNEYHEFEQKTGSYNYGHITNLFEYVIERIQSVIDEKKKFIYLQHREVVELKQALSKLDPWKDRNHDIIEKFEKLITGDLELDDD